MSQSHSHKPLTPLSLSLSQAQPKADKRAQSDGHTRFAGPTKMLPARGAQPFALAFFVIFLRGNVFGDNVHLPLPQQLSQKFGPTKKSVVGLGGRWWKDVEGFAAFALS